MPFGFEFNPLLLLLLLPLLLIPLFFLFRRRGPSNDTLLNHSLADRKIETFRERVRPTFDRETGTPIDLTEDDSGDSDDQTVNKPNLDAANSGSQEPDSAFDSADDFSGFDFDEEPQQTSEQSIESAAFEQKLSDDSFQPTETIDEVTDHNSDEFEFEAEEELVADRESSVFVTAFTDDTDQDRDFDEFSFDVPPGEIEAEPIDHVAPQIAFGSMGDLVFDDKPEARLPQTSGPVIVSDQGQTEAQILELAKLRTQNEKLERESRNLRERLDESLQLSETENSKLFELENELGSLRDQIASGKSANSSLIEELAAAVDEKSAMQKQLATDLTDLESRQESRFKARQNDLVESHQLELSKARSDVPKDVSALLDTLRDDFDATVAEKDSINEQLSRAIKEKQDEKKIALKVDELRSEIAMIADAKTSLQRNFDDANSDRTTLQAKLTDLRSQLESSVDIGLNEKLEKQLELRNQELESVRAEAETAGQETQTRLEQVQKDLEEQHTQHQSDLMELAESKQQLESLSSKDGDGERADESENRYLAEKLHQKRVKLRCVKSKLREKMILVKKLQLEIRRIQQALDNQVEAVQENDSLHDEICDLRVQLENTARQLELSKLDTEPSVANKPRSPDHQDK